MPGTDLTIISMAMAVFAGLTSVASPCVLPVIPIIVTGTKEDHKYRPLLIVLGLAISFMAMGALTSFFGGAVAGKMPLIEKISGGIIIIFGILLLADINIFKKLTIFNNIETNSKGRWSGLFLGLTLGLIWIPCVGPMLSGVLGMVAAKGTLAAGLLLLGFYSLGFAIPMLLLGYASQTFRKRIRLINSHPVAIRVISGCLLIAFGVAILSSGMLTLTNMVFM